LVIDHITQLVLIVMVILTMVAMVSQAGDAIDLDRWHEELRAAIGEDPAVAENRQPALGIYPTLGAAVGPPNWASAQGSAYISFTDGRRFSIYAGYGEEWGPQADAQMITVGWGGVTPIPAASKQLGFHGKYLRYRRWEEEDHGVHHGLSFGTESGVGWGALAFEVGAARSEQNHWLITLEIALKFAVPVHIPLTKKRVESPQQNP
jgi:hypothetical protein